MNATALPGELPKHIHRTLLHEPRNESGPPKRTLSRVEVEGSHSVASWPHFQVWHIQEVMWNIMEREDGEF